MITGIPSINLGPVSRNAILSSIDFARTCHLPVCLIASRRQIDAEKLGGGYVDSTEAFAQYVRSLDKDGLITLARDHGGPYQRENEDSLSPGEAMDQATASYTTDMISGFRIIHIDPEKCIAQGVPDALEALTEMTIELLRRCFSVQRRHNLKDIRFEIGTDEGIGVDFTTDQWAQFLKTVCDFCTSEHMPLPVTMAVPLGTKVKETENIGALALNPHDNFWLQHVRSMQRIVSRFGVELKLHNADYISTSVLRTYLELGVRHINIAPMLGTFETCALVEFFETHDMKQYVEDFYAIAYDSGKWKRWLKTDSVATDTEKAIMAGHYVFSTPLFRQLMDKAKRLPQCENLDQVLQSAIAKSISQYYETIMECQERAKPFLASPNRPCTGLEIAPVSPDKETSVTIADIEEYAYYCYHLAEGQTVQCPDFSCAVVFIPENGNGLKAIRVKDSLVRAGGSATIEQQAFSITATKGAGLVLLAGSSRPTPFNKPSIQLKAKGEHYVVTKPWGHELWINGEHPLFSFKEVFIREGGQTSLQYHNYKIEAALLYKGVCDIIYRSNANVSNDKVQPEDLAVKRLSVMGKICVEPGTLHRMRAATDMYHYEVSTPHLDDVVRVQDDNNRGNGRILKEHYRTNSKDE